MSRIEEQKDTSQQTPLGRRYDRLTDFFERVEADTDWNDDQRAIIDAMQEEHGEAWLGIINIAGDGEPVASWKWTGDLVYNFGADFVLPRRDAQLERMILTRASTPYRGVSDDAPRVDAIINRIAMVGGKLLVWS